jgi:hypothetical protein
LSSIVAAPRRDIIAAALADVKKRRRETSFVMSTSFDSSR